MRANVLVFEGLLVLIGKGASRDQQMTSTEYFKHRSAACYNHVHWACMFLLLLATGIRKPSYLENHHMSVLLIVSSHRWNRNREID